MKKLNNLELVETVKNDKNNQLNLLFFDELEGLIYEVKFNKEKYNKHTGKYEQSDEQEAWANDQLIKELGFGWNNIEQAIGQKKDIYVYDDRERPFNSLWESKSLAKPDEDFYNEHITGVETTIKDISDTGVGFTVFFEIDGNDYKTNNPLSGGSFTYSDWIDSRKAYFPNANKLIQAKKNFKKIFGCDIEDADKFIGSKILVVPAKAGKTVYLKFKLLDATNGQVDDLSF